MKKLMNLNGVTALSKIQQKSINGGGTIQCNSNTDCSHVCGFCTPLGICIYPTGGCV